MADEIPADMASDPTYKQYKLKCTTKFFNKNIKEDIGKGVIQSYKRKLVLLVPEHNDEFNRFARAWLPDDSKQYFELAAVLGGPAHTPSRLSVHLGHDEKLDRPYLFVMSKGAEDILIKYKEGTNLIVTTLPANEDAEADSVEANQGNFEVM